MHRAPSHGHRSDAGNKMPSAVVHTVGIATSIILFLVWWLTKEWARLHAQRIEILGRPIGGVRKKIRPTLVPNRILAEESLRLRIVVARAEKVQAGTIILAACKLRGVRRRRTRRACRAKRIVRVRRLYGT